MINCEERPERPFDTKEEMIQRFKLEQGIDITKEGLVILDEIQVWKEAELYIKIWYDSDEIISKMIATGSRFLGQSKA